MHTVNEIVGTICTVLILLGGVAGALIQVGVMRGELTRLRDDIERLERDHAIDQDRIKADWQREIDGVHREIGDLRGAAAIRGRVR